MAQGSIQTFKNDHDVILCFQNIIEYRYAVTEKLLIISVSFEICTLAYEKLPHFSDDYQISFN